MFPVSGALQLKTSEHQGRRPIISASGAYSRLLSRCPARPHATLARTDSRAPRLWHDPLACRVEASVSDPASNSRCHSTFAGRMWRSMNTCRCDCSCSVLGVSAKSMIFPIESPVIRGRCGRRPQTARLSQFRRTFRRSCLIKIIRGCGRSHYERMRCCCPTGASLTRASAQSVCR